MEQLNEKRFLLLKEEILLLIQGPLLKLLAGNLNIP
jgi:hypothetical protein